MKYYANNTNTIILLIVQWVVTRSPLFWRQQVHTSVTKVFKRNAKAFSFNVVVDVRRRRHEIIFLEYLGNY